MTTIEALRTEVRTKDEEFKTFKTQQTQMMDNLAKALGLKQDDELTPEKFQQELSTRDGKIGELETENKSLKVQMKVNELAGAKGAIPSLVHAHLLSSGKYANLDLAANDFEEKVSTLIDEALQQYPQLRRTGHAPGDAGARGSGAGGGGDVNAMIRSAAGRR